MVTRRLRQGWLGILGVLAAVLLLAAACEDLGSDEPIENKDESFRVGGAPRLVVRSFNGRITVVPGTDGTLRVKATLRRADKVEYRVSQSGDTVAVEASEKGSTIGRSPGADIEVSAPPTTQVELRTSNGNIQVQGLEETGVLETSNGRIVVGGGTGHLQAKTSNGSIEVTNFSGSVALETSNGGITFAGELTPGGDNEMRASNGSVEVALEGIVSVDLDASTSSGRVTSDLPVLTTSAGEDRLVGTIGGGDAALLIRNSNGFVKIR